MTTKELILAHFQHTGNKPMTASQLAHATVRNYPTVYAAIRDLEHSTGYLETMQMPRTAPRTPFYRLSEAGAAYLGVDYETPAVDPESLLHKNQKQILTSLRQNPGQRLVELVESLPEPKPSRALVHLHCGALIGKGLVEDKNGPTQEDPNPRRRYYAVGSLVPSTIQF